MHSFLSLGDSYSVGEGVPIYDSFPYQTVQLLRRQGYPFQAPEIVARTGWTTDELAAGVARLRLLPPYTVVSLLIGVNNQYRGRAVGEYAGQFGALLAEALRLAARPAAPAQPTTQPLVFVLSIPDWGASPFAAKNDHDSRRIALEIDNFNATAREITVRNGLPFIDITNPGRMAGSGPNAFAADGLHPAAATYHYWAQELAAAIGAALPRM